MLPTFFVIGAGKCGTSALHAYLDVHPEIEMTRRKEVHFLLGPDWRTRIEQYDSELEGGTKHRGDTSPGYTVHPRHADTPDRIAEVAPDAKLIYLVRDPVARTIAHYAQHVIKHAEPRPPAEALDPADPGNDYLCTSAYATQAENYLRVFPAERLLVLDQRDLLADRRPTLRRAFAFLDVDPDFWSPAFEERHNVRGGDNRRLPTPLHRAESLASSSPARLLVPKRARHALKAAVRDRFGGDVDITIDDALRARIADRLAPEAARLRELTGQAFAHWSV